MGNTVRCALRASPTFLWPWFRLRSSAPWSVFSWNTGENIKRVLDAGAWGIIVPMVNNRAQAEAVVEAAGYPTTAARS